MHESDIDKLILEYCKKRGSVHVLQCVTLVSQVQGPYFDVSV